MTHAYSITGGRPLRGEVALRGAKNAALPMLLAAAAASGPVRLDNLPVGLGDIDKALAMLREMGVTCSDAHSLDPAGLSARVPAALAGQLRSSLLLLSVGLARFDRIRVPLPGGCRIGRRPFDQHLHGLRCLGAEVEVTDRDLVARRAGPLRGADIMFSVPTTTGTQNVVLAAVFAEGRTILRNANTRPENVAFFEFLRSLGAELRWEPRLVVVDGTGGLGSGHHRVPSGGDEAVTWLIAAAMTGGAITVGPIATDEISHELDALRAAGVEITTVGDRVRARAGRLRPFALTTSPPPGVGSDLQPLFAGLATAAVGTSRITDLRFTERFQYLGPLAAFGARVSSRGNTAEVAGGRPLFGARVRAPDLRGGMATVLVALTAHGTSTVSNAAEIERGYGAPECTLRAMGADMRRVVL